MNKFYILKKFNETTGCSYRMTERVKELFQYLEKDYNDKTDDFFIDVIQNTKEKYGTNLYTALSSSNIENYLKQKEAEINKQKEASGMTLGLIEKALAKVIMDEYAPQVVDVAKEQVSQFIKDTYGEIVKKVTYEVPQRQGKLDEVTHEKFEEVLQFVLADEPVMLTGAAGTGKNVLCKQIAKAMNLDFYFTNAVTQEYKLTGFIDAVGNYQETQFYKAFKNGGLFMLDEIDASIPEVLIILNAAIANRYFDFPIGKVEANPNFRLIAAGNTFGTGANYTYVGRNQLDGASLDRFAVVEIDYSERIENSLTKDQDLLNFIHIFRNACNTNGINHITSYRSITRLDKLQNVIDTKELLKTCLLKNLEKDDLNTIIKEFDFKSKWTEALKKCLEEMN